MASYLRFAPVAPGSDWPGGSVAVLSRKREMTLGVISWYAPWRQYVFEAAPGTVWSNGCLCEVENKVSAMNAERAVAAV